MGRHLAETTRLLAWKHANVVFAFLALISAAATMAIPGPAGDLTGFASVLLVGALALLAGHAWGILVIAVAELLIVGQAWPIVSTMLTSPPPHSIGSYSAVVSVVTALPGLLLFAATMPFLVEVIIGKKGSTGQRPGEILTGVAAVGWILQPLVF